MFSSGRAIPRCQLWIANLRFVLVRMTVAAVCLYVGLDTALMLMPSTKTPATDMQNGPSATDVVAAVSEMPQSNGNVNLMLNVKGIMRFLDLHQVIVDATSMTSDPPPPDVDILEHNPKRCENAVTWLICVYSKSRDDNKRKLLRTSWASNNMFERNDTRVVFFVGLAQNKDVRKRMKKEVESFGDVVQGNFTEDDFNGPIRARLMLKWVATYCEKASFILKVNDDSLVDIIRLMACAKT